MDEGGKGMPDHPGPGASSFDESVDVVVVGYGFAGAVSAIVAHDQGADVLLIEKMADPGGISICSGGGLRLWRDGDAAFAYLKATNDGTTPDDVLRAFTDEMLLIDGYVTELAKTNGAALTRTERPANYPFPGFEHTYFLQVESIPDFDPARAYPHARALAKGPYLFKVVDDNVKSRAIKVRLSSPARRLITTDGEVRGVFVGDGGHAVEARKGVVLACGGFEADAAMQRQHWQINPVLPAAFLGNTGDGVRMAQDVGAGLWHMWHFHGTYGFRHPDFPFAFRTKRLPDWTPGEDERQAPMSWILVDGGGRRFMNEYEPYLQDTGHRPLGVVDMATMKFPYLPCHLIVDRKGMGMYPIASTVFNDRGVEPYFWSQDNLDEVENGILKKADSVSGLANLIGCPADRLEDTIRAWNWACREGADPDFGRPPMSMVPVQTPPFYTGEIWPVVSNTQGGPVHDARQRVLNPFGEPIPRLFAAGELGGIWGNLYLCGGNLTECFVGGRVAGREAAAL